MSNAMYEAASRAGDNPYILHDIKAYNAAKELGVAQEQLDRIERETLELASRLARAGRIASNSAMEVQKNDITKNIPERR